MAHLQLRWDRKFELGGLLTYVLLSYYIEMQRKLDENGISEK